MAGLSDQIVDLGHGSSKIRRQIYDVRTNSELKFQTGYVQHDSSCVAVWRPFDPPLDPPLGGYIEPVWFNLYNIKLPLRPGTRHRSYLTQEVELGDAIAAIPKVELELMFQFRNFLEKAKRK